MNIQQWTPPCNKQCTNRFSHLTQIPWRVFCKKACDADGDTLEECLEQCDDMCYKSAVLKDQQWSAYIDRAPGSASYSEDCHRACVAGCGFKFDIPSEEVDKIQPSKSSKSPAEEEPAYKNKST